MINLITVKTENVKAGMILGQPVLNDDGTIELLSKGSQLSKRHISLLKRLGIDAVIIVEEGEDLKDDKPATVEQQVEFVKEVIKESGQEFDVNAFHEDMKKVEEEDFDYIVRSQFNENMKISVLTGEGNIPIDQKHRVSIEETKNVFNQLRETEQLDIEAVRKNVKNMLPDMVRNNDVLMRLKQLQESDDYTFQHSLRVAVLASMIGKWLGYGKNELYDICEAGLLFDVGKLKIPEFILKKNGKVTPQEFEIIKKHAQLGYTVLLRTKGVSQDVKFAALQHHERMDGSGYPLRIRSGQIHEFAKIIMVCDVYDAMISNRVYRSKLSPFEAAEFISWNSGHTLDSRICYIFLSNLAEFYIGKQCLLNSGEEGTIAYVDVNYPTRPIVRVGNRFIDLTKDKKYQIVDLLN